ncbi:hypothetical protein FAM23852_001702 [Propionibacterium freudenreichii]|uniref:hypothetical protein n=1 Tax=Propionibacterium freudenreichii TaxID=1744 RepID=UPI00254B0805|nr:hypothetical protein [Propionibacterium freudenreichii]MDK9322206.1 hypothetical protein [Propionibacterium freudenreichii]
MTKHNRTPNRSRRRTAKTVHPTHLTVVSTGVGTSEQPELRHVNNLIKASILYADDVELLSPMTEIINQTRSTAEGIAEDPGLFLQSLDDTTLLQLAGPDILKQNNMDIHLLRVALTLLHMNPEDRKEILNDSPQGNEINHQLTQIEESIHGPEMDKMLSDLHQLRVTSGVEELNGVISSRTVTFNPRISSAINSNDLLDQFLDELTKTLNDQYKLILLDPTASPLVTAMQNEGLITPSTRVLNNAKEATLGTGFISCLPAFTTAPMDEIMDLRSDLDEPLSQYRADVAALREEMTTSPFDADVQADILAAWRTRVEPEIQEIRSAMADHGLVREMIQAVDGDIKSLANGTWAPLTIGMLIADKTDINGAIAIGIGALATVGIMARSVTKERARARKDLASHDFYYLYRADEALRSLK